MNAKGLPVPSSEYARRRRRPWLWLGAALACSACLVGVAWVLDQGRAPPKPTGLNLPPITDPLAPQPLTPEERAGAGTSLVNQQAVSLPKGAWVQVAGPDGRVKQQYTAQDIHPLADKRLSLDQPRAVLYGSSGRVVTMRSDTMTAKVPHRELESGRLEGNVVIRLYSAGADGRVDLAMDAAEVVVEAPEAEFDMLNAEIRVDRFVRITSQALTGEFEGLSLTLSPDGRSIERLVVDRALSPIRIERSAAMLRKRGEGLKPAQSSADAPWRGADSTLLCAAQGAVPASPGPEARAYVMTLYDEVRVISRERDGAVSLEGDQMSITFMLKGGMGEGITSGNSDRARRSRGGEGASSGSAGGASSGAASGSVVQAPPAGRAAGDGDGADESIIIDYSGRLEMLPAEAGVAPLADPEGVRISVVGKPARVNDSRSQSTIRAAQVSFESRVESVDLVGKPEAPATLENPKFGISAQRVQLNRATGLGSMAGPGVLRLGRADSLPITVDWVEGGQFTLQPGAQRDPEGTFRSAQFDGGVRVRRRDFSLDARRLLVEAEGEGKATIIRKLVADGGVVAADLGPKAGKLEAQRAEVTLAPDGNGGSQPKRLDATGPVVISDADQVMWLQGMRATFVTVPVKPAAPARQPPAPSEGALLGDGRTQLGTVIAEGAAELLMKDGTRIWSNGLEGDAQARTATLLGPDVLVVRGNSVIDQLSEVHVQDTPAKISCVGPGRVSYYTDRVIPQNRQRMERPVLPQVPMMQATWRESLAFAEGVIPGKLGAPDRGLLLLQGAVKVRAARSAVEEEALDADEVQIETLPHVASAGAGSSRGGSSGGPNSGADMGQVARMTAVGNVRAQAQRWATPMKQGEPQFFRLTSQRVAYDTLAGLCSVDGSGTILVNDPNPPAPEGGSKAGQTAQAQPFSPHGITKFTWQRSLGMRTISPELTTIALDGTVEMQHLGADQAGTGTLAADHLEATVRKAAAVSGDGTTGGAPGGSTPGGGAPRALPGSDGAPILGAGATLEEVLARGKVVVRTAEFDVETGEFSLNERTQVAKLSTTPGRVVTIQKRGEALQRAQSAVWDMKTGIITIDKARGTVAR